MPVDADPSRAASPNVSDLGFSGTPGARHLYDEARPAISSNAFSGGTVQVPAESIVVLTDAEGTAPAPTPTGTESPAPSGSPPPSPSTTPGGCSASYNVTSSWTGGFTGEVTVTAGNAAVPGRKVASPSRRAPRSPTCGTARSAAAAAPYR